VGRLTATLFVLVAAMTARAEWIIIQPPSTGQRYCELQYDPSAPIERWQSAWVTPFATLDACEALRTEMVRRTTSPGRRERLLAAAREHEKEMVAQEKKTRREWRQDPEKKRLLPYIPQQRHFASRICDISLDDWTNTRCIERTE
jgi:hypothetical protein